MAIFVEVRPIIYTTGIIVAFICILSLKKAIKKRSVASYLLLMANFVFLFTILCSIFVYLERFDEVITLSMNLRTFFIKFFYAGMGTVMVFLWLIKLEIFNGSIKEQKKAAIVYVSAYFLFIFVLYYDAYVTNSDIATYFLFAWTLILLLIPQIIFTKDAIKLYKRLKLEDKIAAKGIFYIIISILFFATTYLLAIIEELVLLIDDITSVWITGSLWLCIAASSVFIYLGYFVPEKNH